MTCFLIFAIKKMGNSNSNGYRVLEFQEKDVGGEDKKNGFGMSISTTTIVVVIILIIIAVMHVILK
jgi:hypothetical protein